MRSEPVAQCRFCGEETKLIMGRGCGFGDVCRRCGVKWDGDSGRISHVAAGEEWRRAPAGCMVVSAGRPEEDG